MPKSSQSRFAEGRFSLPELPDAWQALIGTNKDNPFFASIETFLSKRAEHGATIYPPRDLIFNSLSFVPPEGVRVVIIGQDPYHGVGQAHGLAFSVQHGTPVPPSLVNIYKELANDLNIAIPQHGCLNDWAEQGVLLLNSALSVEASSPGSHAKIGWEAFTDHLIKQLARTQEHIVFLLWGSHARGKASLIDHKRHLVLQAPHPSPLSAYRGFLGCGHFSQANDYLQAQGRGVIDWQLSGVSQQVMALDD